jgi:diguanylate cyclase (GGDEF)-like protein
VSAGEIFIVDDNPDNLNLLATILREKRYETRMATNGRRALASIRVAQPEVVMLDITMPDMDGYEVCERLKADAATSHLPVIFISALDDVWDKVKAFRVGGVDYVTKPFHPEEVIARVETQLKLARLRLELEKRNGELERANVQLERANRILQSLSYLDSLTGLANRRHLDEVLEQEWRRAWRERTPLSLVLADIDHFKRYNDTYGHQGGDACLRRVGGVLNEALKRGGDLAARYGGEEFAIVLPSTDSDGAAAFAERVRAQVEGLGIAHERSAAGVVTISVGAATAVPDDSASPEVLVAAADRALYRSKSAGRNRVSLCGVG